MVEVGTHSANGCELWASRGYAAISIDLSDCGPNAKRLVDGGPPGTHSFMFGAIDQPITSQWNYHAVANVIRAHSLIRSFSEIDSNRIALTGISWGGYLTCIVAGLDNRFKAAVPVYGCGFIHENSAWLYEFEKMSSKSKAKWIQLWEPSQYVGSATMPMLFVNGGKDYCYRPDSYAKTYALLKTKTKNIRFSPYLAHGHIFDRPKAIEIFVKHHLNNGTPLAKITSLQVGKNKVTASVTTKKRLVSAKLFYTTQPLASSLKNYTRDRARKLIEKDRKWIGITAKLDENRITVEQPPKNATVWFLNVTDDRNSMVSSKLMFPAEKDNNKLNACDSK